MKPHRSVPSVLVILIAGGLLASPPQAGVAGADTTVTAARAGVPAGVTSSWWAEVRDSLQQATIEQKERPSSVQRALPFPNWTAESNQAGANLGVSVAGAGDVNGDGYDDVIVGAFNYDNGQSDEGRAFAYYGSAAGLSTAANWTAESNQAGANFGISVAGARDVNGDGYDDVVVGAYSYDNGQVGEGRAFAYHGSASGLSTAANWTADSNQESAFFGHSVAGAGDVNGDGYDDVVVGAYSYDNGQVGEGRAFAYHGSASGLSTAANWTAESNQDFASFGHSVAGAGDVNGDGYDDVVVGAPFYDGGQSNEGTAFAYHGSTSGLGSAASWTVESDQAGAIFGVSVAGAGDVNGDGYDEVIVGAYNYSNGQYAEGRAFAYYGSAAGLSTAANWTAETNQEFARFGYSVAGAGDVNGDGYDDVIGGAHGYENGEAEEGRAFVFCGSAAGLKTVPCWRGESNQDLAKFGISVDGAGDVNGDGYDDCIVGAYSYDHGQTDEGVAVAKYGRPD
jgi:hypothetical protein